MRKTAAFEVMVLVAAIAATQAAAGAAAPQTSALEVGERDLPRARAPQAPDRAFGFRVGEERRYTLGPAESLPPQGSAAWSMSLARIEGDAQNFVAVFELLYVERGVGDPYGARLGGPGVRNGSGMASRATGFLGRRLRRR